jgi:hypothetical protein
MPFLFITLVMCSGRTCHLWISVCVSKVPVLSNEKVLVCLNRIRAVHCGAGGLDVVGRFIVEEALLYFDKQSKNKPMLIWCGTETPRCCVCLVPVCVHEGTEWLSQWAWWFVGRLMVNYLDIKSGVFRWSFWISFRATEVNFLIFCRRGLTVNYLDICRRLTVNYLDILSATHAELSRYFVERFTVNYLDILSGDSRWII